MKLIDILKGRGMFRKDINVRMKNSQIKLNGIPLQDLQMDIPIISIEETGDWLVKHIVPNQKWSLQMMLFTLEGLFDTECNIENDLTEFLNDFWLLSISKKESFIIKINWKHFE